MAIFNNNRDKVMAAVVALSIALTYGFYDQIWSPNIEIGSEFLEREMRIFSRSLLHESRRTPRNLRVLWSTSLPGSKFALVPEASDAPSENHGSGSHS